MSSIKLPSCKNLKTSERLFNTDSHESSSEYQEEVEEDVAGDSDGVTAVQLLFPYAVLFTVWGPGLLHLDLLLSPPQLVVGPTHVRTEIIRAQLVYPQSGGLEPILSRA